MENGEKLGQDREVGRIYAGINSDGKRMLEGVLSKEGLPQFREFGAEFDRRLNVWLKFDEASEGEVQKRLTSKIKDIEKDLGIKFFLAQRDFQLHSSLLQGEAEDTDEAETAYVSLVSEGALSDMAETLKDKEIEFKYLLLDTKGNLILVSTKIPEEINEARGKVDHEFTEKKVGPKEIKILHITIGRIVDFSVDENGDVPQLLKDYKKRIIDLRHEISANPFHLKVKSVNLAKGGVAKGGKTAPL